MIPFLFEALRYAPQYGGREPGDVDDEVQHSSGAELSQAVVQFARDSFGSEYRDVLRDWGIHRSEDLGHLVFALVDLGSIEALESDRQEHFDNQFDFRAEWDGPAP